MKIFELTTNQFEGFIRRNSSFQGMAMPHIHEGYEITLMLSGNLGYLFRDSTANITRGSLILIKPFEIHKTLPTEGEYERLLFHFSSNIFSALFSDKVTDEILSVFSNVHLRLNEAEMEAAVNTLMLCKTYLDDGKEELAAIQLAKFLIYTRDFCARSNEKPVKSEISEMMKYINNNISKVSIADVCKKFYISSQNLNDIFKKETHITPHKYIEILKMNYSLELLKEKNLSIDEVAYFCGFNSASYFSSKFKKMYGQTPLNYRKIYKV